MTETMNTYNNSNDGYEVFESNLKSSFEAAIAGGKKLFKTNVQGLYEIYLNNLPPEARQHYTCNGCRHFIDRFGGLVAISEDGVISSVMWDEENTPPFFQAVVRAMKAAVLDAKVKGVFIAEGQVLGIPRTGDWTHLNVTVPREYVNSSRIHSAGQSMAEKREEFNMLTNALTQYSINTVDQAVALLQSETLYRSDRVLGIAEWFQALVEKRNRTSGSNNKENIVWLAVATAPTGFCHVRSSMIGTLLDDIASGMSTDSVAARFKEKMNPSNYMRSQAAPSANKVREDEKLVVKLGLETALQRRYASFEEIPEFVWKDQSPTEQAKEIGSIFGHIMSKDAENSTIALPQSVMTWQKFQRTVLPTAESIEVLIDSPARLMAMVTAVDPSAENILQWNNPFSWYYHGGVDAEIKRRVEEFGGRHEDNEIRVSLIWNGLTDLDLHCITPNGEHIFWSAKKAHRCNGYLDLDMNGVDKNSDTPVENMRWASNAPHGHYRFYVHNYSERTNGRLGTPFVVELEINGKIHRYEGQPLPSGKEVTVFEFDYHGQEVDINSAASHSPIDSWSVEANQFVKVNGITNSPNLWDGQEMSHSGTHVFFLLDGVKDLSEGKGRGFFNEMLKSDLRQIRKTLEAYTANTPIQGAEEATACGVGYSKDNEWELTVKVKSNSSTRVIKIDRWD